MCTCQHLAHSRCPVHPGKPSLASCRSRAALRMSERNSEDSVPRRTRGLGVNWSPTPGTAWPEVWEGGQVSGLRTDPRGEDLRCDVSVVRAPALSDDTEP